MPTTPLVERVAALEVANAEITGRLVEQNNASDRIDTKSATVAGFAIVALPFFLLHAKHDVAAYLAGALLALSLVLSVVALSPREYKWVPEPKGLMDEYTELIRAEVPNTKERLLASLVATKRDAFEINVRTDKRKVRWWWLAVASLALGLLIASLALDLGSNSDGGRQRHQPRHRTEHPGRTHGDRWR